MSLTVAASAPVKRGRGRPSLPIILHPEPLWPDTDDPADFAEALSAQMKRHGDTAHRLHRAVKSQGGLSDQRTLSYWRRGLKTPRTVASLKVVDLIEARYRLEPGRLRGKLPRDRATSGHTPPGLNHAETRRLAWHLPHDFRRRSKAEQAEILDWVRSRILSSGTDYSRYQSEVSRHRFGFRFDKSIVPSRHGSSIGAAHLQAPEALQEEMRALVRFKSATLTDLGFSRSGVWGRETAAQRGEHLALMFGALAADPQGEVGGLGVPAEALSFALLVVPAVWDWYIRWRELRRGFFTRWEAEMLLLAAAFTREEFGWVRQNPGLAERLQPIPGILDAAEIADIQSDWAAACDRMNRHALARAREVQRVARVHRDPFEPILPVLEAASPVGEYLKIVDEAVRCMPDARYRPKAAAESVRGVLMLRLGLHLGLRQKNLRQLLACQRGAPPRSERELERLKRGELRWSERDGGWEVFIPCAAFKNAGSAYFSRKPFRLILPDLGGLYDMIEVYLDRHRALLLAGASDPGVFFVKSMTARSRDAAYNQTTFYEAWRLMIQRYGIYNPWTGRGAIEGLLPHGPHSVRDVLATHILKVTGSYEQASYAIQDTAKTVAEHYGRFLPQDKAALAAKVLDSVWTDRAA